MGELQFLFRLCELANVQPWGNHQHWFGLSEGTYCIDTRAGRLLEYRDEAAPDADPQWIAYYGARLFEDLLEILPSVLEPVPEDVTAAFFRWLSSERREQITGGDEEVIQAWLDAERWWDARCLNLQYLQSNPKLHFWRVGLDVQLWWEPDRGASPSCPWTVARADLRFPVDVFRQAASAFFRDFLSAMGRRVLLIQQQGWARTDCTIDIPALVDAHRQREESVANALQQGKSTDWSLVRSRLQQLLA